MKRTKKTTFEQKLNNYILAVTLLLVTVPPTQYVSRKHTENYKNLMASVSQFEATVQHQQVQKQNPIMEAIVPTVHAQTIEVKEKKDVVVSKEHRMTDDEVKSIIDKSVDEKTKKYSDYVYRILTCENKRRHGDYFDAKRTNTKGNNPSTSVDVGLAMINSYWHSEVTREQAEDPEFSIKFLIKMIASGKQHEWMCDPLVRAKPDYYRNR